MKKVIIVLSIVAFILCTIGLVGYFKNKSNYDVANPNFYEAISMLKEEKYNEAYKLSNNIENVNEQRTIRNIIAYSYLTKITNCLAKMNESKKIMSDIIDEVSISASVYDRIDISSEDQSKIDKLNKEITQEYEQLNSLYNKESLYEDLADLYNSYDEVIKSYDGLNSNLKQKLSIETKRIKYLEDMNKFINKMKELSNHIEDVQKLHPVNEIPEQYRIMFDLESVKK